MARSDVWLVTGGAGYIGGHTVARLHADGISVVVVDDLSSGQPHRVPAEVPLIETSVLDQESLTTVLKEHQVTGVIHFAGKKSVPESVDNPLLYYRENVGGLTGLLGAMVEAGVGKFVLSSSAAVYGMPPTSIITEATPADPISPYGHSKLVMEQITEAVGRAHGVSWLALRYFNAVGADSPAMADLGGTNLFPLVLRAFAEQRPVLVTGDDFDTQDGTGVRDYIHVADLADAHIAAVMRLARGPTAQVINIGTGKGYSVLDVLAALGEVTGQPVPYEVGPRRPGDPAAVIAAIDLARTELGWTAKRDLKDMVASAWFARRALGPL